MSPAFDINIVKMKNSHKVKNQSILIFTGILIFFLFHISFGYRNAYSQKLMAPGKMKKNLLDHFLLVRSHDLVYWLCKEPARPDAIAILKPNYHFMKREEISIISNASGILKGTVIYTIKQCIDDIPVGALEMDEPLEWRGLDRARLGIRGKKPSPDRIGSVKPHSDILKETKINKFIRSQIPLNEQLNIQNISIVLPPSSSKKYIFVHVSHFDPKIYKKAGDNAVTDIGFLFIDDTERTMVLKEQGLTKIYNITDLDKDGIFELLIFKGGRGGTYEIWLFNGKEFTGEKKILYEAFD